MYLYNLLQIHYSCITVTLQKPLRIHYWKINYNMVYEKDALAGMEEFIKVSEYKFQTTLVNSIVNIGIEPFVTLVGIELGG